MLSVPETPITLPADVAKAIAAARDQVSIAEAELTRLRKLIKQEQLNLNDVVTKRAETEEALSVITKELELTTAQLEAAKPGLEQARVNLAALNSETREITDRNKELETVLDAQAVALNAREKKLDEREADLAAREASNESARQALASQREKAQQFLNGF